MDEVRQRCSRFGSGQCSKTQAAEGKHQVKLLFLQ